MTYRVRNWGEKFEKSDSRKCKNMRWVGIPNQHDEKNFRRIVAHERNTDIFSAWILIIQVASKMPTRGTLADGDGPLTVEDLSCITGFPKEIFELAFPILVELGWLEKVDDSETSRDCPDTSGDYPDTSG